MILPSPGRDFTWRQTRYGPALVCPALRRFARHFFSTRPWALGSGPSQSDDEAPWGEVAEAIGVRPDRLARMGQVHGTEVVMARRSEELPRADILIGDDPALAMAVQVADCAPLLIADSRTGAVSAVHAGWRGLAARAPAAAVGALAAELGSRAADLVAAVGPSIGPCCYEVGVDVRRRFIDAGFAADVLSRWFLATPVRSEVNWSVPTLQAQPRPDHWFFDVSTAACDQLEAAGVPRSHIFIAGLCTASHPDLLCSYRRDGRSAGRLAGAIRCSPRRP